MINILFIHQSAELYGSDKTLLLLLKHLDRKKFNPIVILPFDGPLKSALEFENIKVYIFPVLKLHRKMFSPKNLFQFFIDINNGIKMLDKLNKVNQFDLIYSNTLAVLLGIIYAKKRKIKHIWHVHEIIESPKIFTKLFCQLLQLKSNTKIVYNSIATQRFWDINNSLSKKSVVIWNGLEKIKQPITDEEKEKIRTTFFNASSNEIVIALVGRISRWKGQLVLLDAFKILSKNNLAIKLVYIGSPPPNQDNFLFDLKQTIEKNKLTSNVSIIPFQKEISKFWQSIDIAVVPSIEPEPFGLVAVEAMLANKPVIASNHGGLTEIIINNYNGFLVAPNNDLELANAIQLLINYPTLRIEQGENGYKRALQEFSVESYVKKFEAFFDNITYL